MWCRSCACRGLLRAWCTMLCWARCLLCNKLTVRLLPLRVGSTWPSDRSEERALAATTW